MQEERSGAPGAAPKLSPVFFRELKEGFTADGDGFSPHFISAAENQATPENQEEEDEDDFEFAFFVDDRSNHEPDDDVQSPPIFPIFNRDVLSSSTTASDEEVLKPVLGPLQRLMIEEREVCSRSGSTSSSSSTEELEADAPGVYCVWRRKAPESCKKSSSTGTSSLGGRIRDLVVGRSHSEGKQKYIYLVPEEKRASTQPDHPIASPSREAAPPKVKAAAAAAEEKGKGKGKGKGAKGKERRLTEMDMVTAHRLLYGKGSEAAAGAGGVGGRRSFLPYRRNFLGFFSDVNTHGRPL